MITDDNAAALDELAVTTVLAFAKEHNLDIGETAFHAPATWSHQYGRGSRLVVVYGGQLAAAMNMDRAYERDCAMVQRNGGPPDGYEPYALYEGLQKKLREVGLYFEECTGWYAAIYNVQVR